MISRLRALFSRCTERSQTSSDLARLPRLDGWDQRVMLPPTAAKIAQAPWKEAKDLPGYDAWEQRAATHGRIDADLRMYITRGSVPEIIIAAGGIEREIQALRTAVQIAQAFADANKQFFADPNTRLIIAAGPHAAYAAMNALTWTRAVKERVSRNDPTGNPAAGNPWGPAGLLACLKDGPLRTKIASDFANIRPTLDDARKFDNYVLHAGAIQGSKTPGFRVKDGKAYFPFPDAINQRITTWEEFEYDDERDALSYLESLLDAVATFIDNMLNAFDVQP